MKISNETKVGILTIVALVILIVGFNFLKGKDVFSRSKKIYAVFKELGTPRNPMKSRLTVSRSVMYTIKKNGTRM